MTDHVDVKNVATDDVPDSFWRVCRDPPFSHGFLPPLLPYRRW